MTFALLHIQKVQVEDGNYELPSMTEKIKKISECRFYLDYLM